MKKIFLLGSTGSIGKNTLEVVSENPDHFKISTLVTNQNIELLAKQITEYKPRNALIYDNNAFIKFQNQYDFPDTEILNGKEGLKNLIQENS